MALLGRVGRRVTTGARSVERVIALCLALVAASCGAATVAPVATTVSTGETSPPVAAEPIAAESGPPPSVRFASGATDRPCLPEHTTALLLFASADTPLLDGALDPGSPVGAFGGDGFVLAPEAAHVRAVLGAESRPIDRATAASWGVDGMGALVEVDLAPDAHGCDDARSVGVLSARRLDASAALPIDIGRAITSAIDDARDGTAARTALDDRARQALEAQLADAPSGRMAGLRHRVFYGARWSAEREELTVLVVFRVERDVVTTERSPDDHAGRVWCDAPPGADCAPRCVPSTVVITTTFTGEAGVTTVFSRDGSRVRTTEEPAGAVAQRRSMREGTDDCM
jgi:hypothetical protein